MNVVHKKNAKIIGWLFVLAAVTSIIGLALYNPILKNTNYLSQGINYHNQIVLGAIFELLLVCSAAGTAIMLFPYLSRYKKNYALAYFTFRVLEVIFIMIGIVSILSLLKLSESYASMTISDKSSYSVIGYTLKSIHKWTFMLGPNFMLGLNTFFYSVAFCKSALITKKLALLGIISALLIFIASILELFGVIEQLSIFGFVLAFPIFIYEMSLAVFLIRKGFDLKE